ncbi:hypothetical protein SAMN05216582_10491 [Selenomonas ruminantium]|uniref:Uncharacterized protein n=1 Tax=Selenomonas ruminantium TaxID=971 RepID=A0A1M6SIA8_SELRU|nr:hypothetical protein [Selenomonas ruminantium]SHK44471.1 hypothetical protein SAMN05216582_10491 [Selenomonas ruminantium]
MNRRTLWKTFRPALAVGLAACLVGGIAGAEPVLATDGHAVSAQAGKAVRKGSLQPIAGIWREAGATAPQTLTIYADGAYTLVSPDRKAFGKVRVTAEKHPDGSKSLWYSFYEDGGVTLEDKDTASPWYAAFKSANELWAAFPKTEKAATQTDMRSGHDGAIHFVRYAENNYAATSEGVQADDYLGVWGCGRCTAVISRETSGGYLVEVQWASSAAEGSRWTYHCTYDNFGALLFSDDNGTRTDYTYTEKGTSTNKKIYNDGSSTFVLREGVLTWQDKKENSGTPLEFMKSPQ